MTDKLTRSQARLMATLWDIIEIDRDPTTAQAKVYTPNPQQWHFEAHGPAWSNQTFCSVANLGLITVEYGFADSATVRMTQKGIDRMGGGVEGAAAQ